MRQEIDDKQLEEIAGGKAYINHNTQKIAFSANDAVLSINSNCPSSYDIQGKIAKFKGVYATEAEHDAAVINYLVNELKWCDQIN